MPRLFELDEAVYQAVQSADQLDDAGLPLNDEEWLGGITQFLQGEVEKKYRAISHVLRQMDSDEAAVKIERERLQAVEKSIASKRDRLKEWAKEMLVAMMETGEDLPGFKDHLSKLVLQKSPPSVEIVDEQDIPTAFVSVVTERKIDKKALADELKDGRLVAGAKLITDGVHLRYK